MRKHDSNPFRHPGKRKNYDNLIKAGYSPAKARRLVESNPRWK